MTTTKTYRLTAVAPDAFAETCARVLFETVKNKPDAVIGLSTGRTTGDIHRRFAALVRAHNLDVSRLTIFGLDEVTGVSRDYFGACVWMLEHECVNDLGIAPENFLMLPLTSDDWERDCDAFRAELARRGGITLLELGLGENGHIGFNQPGTPFEQRAFHGRMHDYLEARIRRETGTPDDIPLGGVTLGIADVMDAHEIMLCVNGAHKKQALTDALWGPVTTDLPATALQAHPNLRIICDTDAAPDPV